MMRDVSELGSRLTELDAVADHLPPEVVARRVLSLAVTGVDWEDGGPPPTKRIAAALERRTGETVLDAFRAAESSRLRAYVTGVGESGPELVSPMTDAAAEDVEPPNPDGHVCYHLEIPYPDRTDETAVSEALRASIEVSEIQAAAEDAEAGATPEPEPENTGAASDVSDLEGWPKSGEAAELLGVSRAWVTMQCRAGTLNGVRTALGWLVDPEEIRRRLGGEEPETKRCERCGDVEGPKPIDSFQVHGQNGRRYDVCKACVRKANQEARRRKNEPEQESEESPPRTGVRAFVAPAGVVPASVGESELAPRAIGEATTGPPSISPAVEPDGLVEVRVPVGNPALSDAPDREPYVDDEGRKRCANRNRCVGAMGFEEGDREPAVLSQSSPHLICRGCRKRAGQIG